MIEAPTSQHVWQRRMKFTVAALGGVAGAALAAGAGIGYYVADQITRPVRHSPMDELAMSPFETGADYEEVTFPTASGERPVTDRMPLVAIRARRRPRHHRLSRLSRQRSRHLVGIGTALWRAGFNVLIFDYYGHGADFGRRVTLAYHEVHDLLAALAYARAAHRGRAGRRDRLLDGRVGGDHGCRAAEGGAAVVADSPFTRTRIL